MENTNKILQWNQYPSDTGVIHILEIHGLNSCFSEAVEVLIIDNDLILRDVYYGSTDVKITPLPKGDWELLGYYHRISEENAARIMPSYKNGYNEPGFPYFDANGIADDVNVAFTKAIISLQTLIVNYFQMYQKSIQSNSFDFIVLFNKNT